MGVRGFLHSARTCERAPSQILLWPNSTCTTPGNSSARLLVDTEAACTVGGTREGLVETTLPLAFHASDPATGNTQMILKEKF